MVCVAVWELGRVSCGRSRRTYDGEAARCSKDRVEVEV